MRIEARADDESGLIVAMRAALAHQSKLQAMTDCSKTMDVDQDGRKVRLRRRSCDGATVAEVLK